tara:strand:+ start:225 stop:434 length:210 start_codon:yes stop_codon:yes gene_type:complete
MKFIANTALLLIATVYTIVGFHLIDFMESQQIKDLGSIPTDVYLLSFGSILIAFGVFCLMFVTYNIGRE